MLLGIIALLIIILSAASVYVHYNKQKIIAKVKDAFAKNVNGGLQIGNIDIAVWTHFPNIAIDIENVTVSDSLRHIPLLKAREISCRISLFQLATGKPDVEKLKVSDGLLHLFIDSTGFDNSYLLSPKKKDSAVAATAPASQPVIIHKIELNNFLFISEQARNDKAFQVTIHSANASIERQDSSLIISADEDCLIKGLGFKLEKGSYLENTTVKAKWQLKFNTVSKILDIKESNALINNNNFRISANFNFNDTGSFTLRASADKILFKDAVAILTKKIQSKLTFASIEKPLSVEALLIGKLKGGGDPYVHVTCLTQDNNMKTTFASFQQCAFTGVYDNQIDAKQKPSDPNSVVFFKHFTGKWSGLEMVGDSIRIDNLETPNFFFNFHSQCSFQQLDDIFNLSTVSFTEGSAKLNLQYNGPLIIDYSMFANITGALHIENGKITYVPHNLQFQNCNGDIAFSKNSIVIKKITCNYKKNDFTITGTGNSINSALMATGKSAIACNIFCPVFNAADFKAVFASNNTVRTTHKSQSFGSTVSSMDDILNRGDIQLNINAKQLLLEKFTAQNAKISLSLQQNDWHMQRASLNFDGGSIDVDATVHRDGNKFSATSNLDIKNADAQKVFYAFDNFGQSSLTANNIRGVVNTSFALKLQLDNTGGIVPGSINGTANFSVINGALINFKPLMSIQEYALKNRDLANVSFAEIKNNLTIQQNQILVPRMEIASTAMRLFVEGTYGIDTAATDISIQVPLSNLSSSSVDKAPDNKGVDAKVGPSIYVRAKSRSDGKVKLSLDLFRKFRKNKADN